jgi:hypothetical protein
MAEFVRDLKLRPMWTRRKRLKFLVAEVDRLADEIESSGRQEEVVRVASQVQGDPSAVLVIGDEEWRHLLPAEREKALPVYYLTLRSELVELERDGRSKQKDVRAKWLDGSAPKAVGMLAGIGSLIELGIHALHAAGVLAQEDQNDLGSSMDLPGGGAKTPSDPLV